MYSKSPELDEAFRVLCPSFQLRRCHITFLLAFCHSFYPGSFRYGVQTPATVGKLRLVCWQQGSTVHRLFVRSTPTFRKVKKHVPIQLAPSGSSKAAGPSGRHGLHNNTEGCLIFLSILFLHHQPRKEFSRLTPALNARNERYPAQPTSDLAYLGRQRIFTKPSTSNRKHPRRVKINYTRRESQFAAAGRKRSERKYSREFLAPGTRGIRRQGFFFRGSGLRHWQHCRHEKPINPGGFSVTSVSAR